MGKVVTSQGLQEFVASGKFTKVPDHKPGAKAEAAPEVKPETKPEVKAEEPKADAKVEETKPVETADDSEGLEDGDKEFPERVRRRINQKHRAMKEAQELAEENERFAEQQFNERRLAEKRAQEAEARARELEAKVTPPKAAEPELKAPSYDDKDADGKFLYRDAGGQVDWDKYTDAKAEYKAELAVQKERQRQADERAAQEAEKVKERTIKGANESRKRHSDFDEVLSSIKGTPADIVPQYVLDYMHEDAEFAGELAYYFAKNPEERERISNMTPRIGTAELGLLKAKLTSSVEKPIAEKREPATVTPIRPERGGAPAPITPLNGEGVSGVVTDPSKMDFKQLRAYERARRAKH